MESHADRLLRAMSERRRDYMQGKLDSLTWIRERRMIINEAKELELPESIIQTLSRS